MKIFKSSENWNDFRKSNRLESVGFVPTMGSLHEGHLTLIEKSISQNPKTICSIFVNPKQFNNKSDFTNYPINYDKDIELLEKHKCDFVYLPTFEAVYPDNFKTPKLSLENLDKFMEGEFRPKHFDGVIAVLFQLFNQVNAQKSYFGEKDFQQLKIVEFMVKELGINTEIIPVSIHREKNGLAYSSRNKRLNEQDKKDALIIYKSLNWVKENFKKTDWVNIKLKVNSDFEYSNLKLEYFHIVKEEKLQPTESFDDETKRRVFIAAYCNNVRLIDNLKLYD